MARDPRSWLTRYLTLQVKVDKRVVLALNKANRDAEARIRQIRGKTNVSSRVERAQLLSAQVEIYRVLAEMWLSVGDITRAGQAEAAALAIDQGWAWDQILMTRVYGAEERAAMKKSLQQTASVNVEAAVARITTGGMPLSARVYRSRDLTNDAINRKINSALARGLSWKQFAGVVKDSILPSTPGGVAYAAKRLARTETNNAYHAITVQSNADKPWNTGMEWKTSGSHPKPDICNLYQDRSPYPLGQVPPKPHPQCLCVTFPDTVSVDEFVQQFRAGAYDDYINRNYSGGSRRVA